MVFGISYLGLEDGYARVDIRGLSPPIYFFPDREYKAVRLFDGRGFAELEQRVEERIKELKLGSSNAYSDRSTAARKGREYIRSIYPFITECKVNKRGEALVPKEALDSLGLRDEWIIGLPQKDTSIELIDVGD